MKKILLMIALLSLSVPSYAEDQSSGCGLGWQLFKKNSLVSSFLRSVTNAVTLNTLAMTTGTSGCARHDIVMRDKAAQYYAEANYQKLQTEFAEGQGEHLEAFANILGCFGSTGPIFQNNYEKIFPTDQVGPTEMLENVKSSLRNSSLVSCAIGV